ncbi:MAG: RNA methyltransferase [Acidobacteria bacterium]|nr:RNA methyltransferase [Acidobacteriota bacterium]
MIQHTTPGTLTSRKITSAKNPLLREVRRALTRGELTADGCCIVETFHLLEEAIRSNRPIRAVLAAESVGTAVATHVKGLRHTQVQVVPDELFQAVVSTESAQGVIALVEPPSWTVDELFRGTSFVLILDGVQDPGNAGTMVRTAEAFGATGAMFLKGSVSPFNAKTLRASAGSLFRLPFLHTVDADVARAALQQRRVDVYAADPHGEKSLQQVDLTRRCALLVGSEAHGVSAKMRGCALDVRIPTAGVESLNAAVAASVILYEAARQRMLAAGKHTRESV